MEKRYYYKKDGKPAYNLKEPLSNILVDTTGYVEITKEEWDAIQPTPHVPSEQELARQAKQREIAEKKQYLQATDYAIIKIAEGAATVEEYAEVITLRQAARARINELEAELL